ncbi:MAG: helix-turn-helix domain-containing protein [Microthrixaceae bacterium]
MFTVAEAAVVLRIGRTTAYELVRRDFDSGGGEGLAVVRVGGQFRVPRSALERIVGGPVTCLVNDGSPSEPAPLSTASPAMHSRGQRSTSAPSSSSADAAPTLPFA